MKLTREIFCRLLPIYLRLWPTRLCLAMWSAPTEPAQWQDYWLALRITIRHEEGWGRILLVIKPGRV